MFSSVFGAFLLLTKVPYTKLFHLAKSLGNKEKKEVKNEPDKNHNHC